MRIRIILDKIALEHPVNMFSWKKKFVQVACGETFNMIKINNGEVYGCGDNSWPDENRQVTEKKFESNRFAVGNI